MEKGYWLARRTAVAMVFLAVAACSGSETPEVAAAEVTRAVAPAPVRAEAQVAAPEAAPDQAGVDAYMTRLDAEEREMARTKTKAAGTR